LGEEMISDSKAYFIKKTFQKGEQLMSVKKEYLSPCGMYCSVCAVRSADLYNDQKLKEILAAVFGTSPENVVCDGCMSENTFQFAKTCSIRACAEEKSLEGCYQCDDFPCNNINNFPFEISRNMMLEAIPRWKELGTERWVTEVEDHYTCSNCGALLHRFASQCPNCQTPKS
jgi:hypothetical protein